MKIQQHMRVAAILGSVLALTAQAEIAGVQFSAEMVSRGPDASPSTGRMYVGDGRIRIEMTQEGRDIVRINDHNRRIEWILFPDQKNYLERAAPEGDSAPAPMPAPSAETNPCAGLQGVNCRRAGEEEVAGRAAVKWEMTVTHEGQTLTGAQWLDVQRGLPLKYQMPNGQSMELHMLGTETIDGRSVEKWEMTTVIPNQQPIRTFQWYDPELKLSVREEFPGGHVRELDKIQIGAQPDDLFSVPAGYTRLEMPPMEPGQ